LLRMKFAVEANLAAQFRITVRPSWILDGEFVEQTEEAEYGERH